MKYNIENENQIFPQGVGAECLILTAVSYPPFSF